MGIWSVRDLGGNTSSQIKTNMNFGQVNTSKSNGRGAKPLSFQSGPAGSHEVSGSAHKIGLGWPDLHSPGFHVTLCHIAPWSFYCVEVSLSYIRWLVVIVSYCGLVVLTKLVIVVKTRSSPKKTGMHVVTQVPPQIYICCPCQGQDLGHVEFTYVQGWGGAAEPEEDRGCLLLAFTIQSRWPDTFFLSQGHLHNLCETGKLKDSIEICFLFPLLLLFC